MATEEANAERPPMDEARLIEAVRFFESVIQAARQTRCFGTVGVLVDMTDGRLGLLREQRTTTRRFTAV